MLLTAELCVKKQQHESVNCAELDKPRWQVDMKSVLLMRQKKRTREEKIIGEAKQQYKYHGVQF